MHPAMSNGLAAANNQPAETYTLSTNDLDYPQSERRSKAESNLCAVLALAGHSVHPLRDGGYLVTKWGYTYQADDIADLQAFAVRLGVCHE